MPSPPGPASISASSASQAHRPAGSIAGLIFAAALGQRAIAFPNWVAVVYLDWQAAQAPHPDSIIAAALEMPRVPRSSCSTRGASRPDRISTARGALASSEFKTPGRKVALAGSLDCAAIDRLETVRARHFCRPRSSLLGRRPSRGDRPAPGGAPGRGRALRSRAACRRAAQADSDVKPHALSQRKLAAVVDRARLPSHVRLPGIRAGFPPAARGLLPAKRTTDLGARRADVHIGDAAIRSGRRQEFAGFAQVVREDGRRQPLLDRVLNRNRFLGAFDSS